ncbi:uncharacterized protein LOC100835813 [Brachypodium distachyon]|uniref:uncharacterized protein LOC100835813 n=1 Tax=Brachypodium distachyon TaxID=15368 RepID=UPI0001D42DE2|nr:uncharacterized protein LOC100835813 [Brachypodium distachyon]|eukprot:XP_003562723.1 uncharacterized protein LOC100835813 [Brachypodium distachyon]
MAFPKAPAAARRLLLPSGAALQRTAAGFSLGFDIDDFAGLWELIKAKAAELAPFFTGLLAALSEKADELFPPETRSETLGRWLHVAFTVAAPAALGALALFCCCRCCCCCRSGRGRGGGRRTTMVAPGRGGARMPRGAFEGNPRGYFRDLRANKPLVY